MKTHLLSLSVMFGLSLAIPAIAQTNAGFIIFGNARDTALDYCLDSGNAGQFDRYYLQVRTQRFKYSEVIVTYPQHFGADLDQSEVELFQTNECRGGRKIALESVVIDKEARRITVIPREPIPANTPVRLVISNVRNPRFGGLFQLDARVLRADVPVPVFVGSWVVGIE